MKYILWLNSIVAYLYFMYLLIYHFLGIDEMLARPLFQGIDFLHDVEYFNV